MNLKTICFVLIGACLLLGCTAETQQEKVVQKYFETLYTVESFEEVGPLYSEAMIIAAYERESQLLPYVTDEKLLEMRKDQVVIDVLVATIQNKASISVDSVSLELFDENKNSKTVTTTVNRDVYGYELTLKILRGNDEEEVVMKGQITVSLIDDTYKISHQRMFTKLLSD